jgi:hypothetical protein
VDTLTVTAANSEPGQFATSLPQTITVTDPPVSTTPGGLPGRIDVIGSGPLSDNPDFGGGADSIGRSVGLLANYMASGLVPAGYEGLGNALADRAGSLPGEIPSLVQPSRLSTGCMTAAVLDGCGDGGKLFSRSAARTIRAGASPRSTHCRAP